MKKAFLALIAFSLFLTACSKDDSPTPAPEPEVKLNDEVHDFVWKGLNDFYLWKDNVPNLADTKDDVQKDYFTFLNGYSKPEDLFDGLLYQPNTIDKYSWIVDDYVALEQQFSGVSKSNGVDFQLVRLGDTNELFAYVKLILPNTDAANKNIKRGDMFLEVNGQQLTIENYRSLLFGANDTYELGLASIENNTISLTGEKVSLTKAVYTENPVYLTKTINKNGKKIGYLMYNSFTANFDEQLNNAFGELKAAGIDELVLDLRYNRGGSVRSATYLASMLTGQFNGQLFAKERWNAKWQNIFETQAPQFLVNNFTDEIVKTDSNDNVVLQATINSLNLTKLYIIISNDSASASELIINGLNPYLDVTLIGEKTEGKYIGSITLYDSENFFRSGNNLNTNHKYAMQPITLEIQNKLGENDKDGFDPNIVLAEEITDMGVIGEESDPLLARALNEAAGVATKSFKESSKFSKYQKVFSSKKAVNSKSEMYVSKNKDFYDFLKEHK